MNRNCSKALEELKWSFPGAQALGLAGSTCSLKVDDHEGQQETDENKPTALASLCCFLLKGSSKRQRQGNDNGLVQKQKKLMENCFDAGENDKRMRYTSQSCQALTYKELGKAFMLTELQIVSYWGAYRRRKKSH